MDKKLSSQEKKLNSQEKKTFNQSSSEPLNDGMI